MIQGKRLNALGRKRRPRIQDDVIGVRVSKSLKGRFLKYSKKKGEKPGVILRKQMRKLLGNVG